MECVMFTKITKKIIFFTVLALFINPVLSAPEQTNPEQTSPEQANNEGQVSRALFTSAVQNREPIDQLDILSELISEAFFFTEFKDFQDRTLTHQWSHNGKVSHSIPFVIKGKRWRVFSSKTFMSGAKQEGSWTVKILDEDGTVLSESHIDYIRPSTDAELTAALKEKESTIAQPETQNMDKADSPEESSTADKEEQPSSSASQTEKASTQTKQTENTDDSDKTDSQPKEDNSTSPSTPTVENITPATAKKEASEDKRAPESESQSKDEDNEETEKDQTSSSDAPIWDTIK